MIGNARQGKLRFLSAQNLLTCRHQQVATRRSRDSPVVDDHVRRVHVAVLSLRGPRSRGLHGVDLIAGRSRVRPPVMGNRSSGAKHLSALLATGFASARRLRLRFLGPSTSPVGDAVAVLRAFLALFGAPCSALQVLRGEELLPMASFAIGRLRTSEGRAFSPLRASCFDLAVAPLGLGLAGDPPWGRVWRACVGPIVGWRCCRLGSDAAG